MKKTSAKPAKTKTVRPPKKPRRVKRKLTPSPVLAPPLTPLLDGEVVSEKYHLVNEEKIPQAVWDAVLEDLKQTGNITRTCARVGVKWITVFKKRKRDAEYAKAFEEAHAAGLSHLEDFAVARATQGVHKDVYFQGEVVGSYREYSDQLLAFLLQGSNPKYKRKQEISGPDNGPIGVLVQLTDKELEEKIAQLERDVRDLGEHSDE